MGKAHKFISLELTISYSALSVLLAVLIDYRWPLAQIYALLVCTTFYFYLYWLNTSLGLSQSEISREKNCILVTHCKA